MTQLKIVLPVLMATLCSVYGATVRTATEGFVTNRVAQAAAAATNYTDAATTNAVKLSENKPEENARIVLWDYDAASNNPRVAAPTNIRVGDLAPGDYENVSNRAVNAVQTTDADWLDVVARTSKITSDTFGVSYVFKGTADYAYRLMSEDGSHELVFQDGRWTGFDWAGIRYRPLAYLSEVSAAAQAATNHTDSAVAGKLDTEGDHYAFRNATPGLTIDSVLGSSARTYVFAKPGYEGDPDTVARLSDIPESVTPSAVTNIVRELSLGGIWDSELEVWWTPVMVGGSLTYQATTNVNLNAEN